MRILLLTFSFLITVAAFSQNVPVSDPSALQNIQSIPPFVDSIRAKILSDTMKFNPKDIIHTNTGARNSNSYSPLFFINIRYQYKLDIVNGNDVLAFINEMLVTDKIESINLMNESRSLRVFGVNGRNGAIVIELKGDAIVNFNVAGFKMNKHRGDNFSQIKNGEIIIRE